MKKIILCICVLSLVLGIPSVAYAAVMDENAITISDEARELLGVRDDGLVFEVYTNLSLISFSFGAHIDDFTDLGLPAYCVTVDSTGSVSYKEIKNGIANSANPKSDSYLAFAKILEDNERILDVLGKDIEVKRIYCIDDTFSPNGIYVYYVTDIGDYVYYRRDISKQAAEYLLPINDFNRMAKSTWNYCVARNFLRKIFPGQELETGGHPITKAFNLKPYDLSHYTAESYGWVMKVISYGVPTLLITGGGLWIFFRIRKKTKTHS